MSLQPTLNVKIEAVLSLKFLVIFSIWIEANGNFEAFVSEGVYKWRCHDISLEIVTDI